MPAQTKEIEMAMEDNWDRRFLSLARYVSKWSKRPDAQVGAVLASKTYWPLAIGYHGQLGKIEGGQSPEIADYAQTSLHAEHNVLLQGKDWARDGTLYVFGRPVCPRCAALTIQAGVARVIGMVPNPTKYPDSDSHREGNLSLQMFEYAGVTFEAIAERMPFD